MISNHSRCSLITPDHSMTPLSSVCEAGSIGAPLALGTHGYFQYYPGITHHLHSPARSCPGLGPSVPARVMPGWNPGETCPCRALATTTMATVHSCRWEWCRTVFDTHSDLVDHIKSDHLMQMRPVTKRDAAAILRAEGYTPGECARFLDISSVII
jgi:hypothetical protein